MESFSSIQQNQYLSVQPEKKRKSSAKDKKKLSEM